MGLPSGGLVNTQPKIRSTAITDAVTAQATVSLVVSYIAAAIIVAKAPAATWSDAARPCAAACRSSGTETDTSIGPDGKPNPSKLDVIIVRIIRASKPSTKPKVQTKTVTIARVPTAHLLAPKR